MEKLTFERARERGLVSRGTKKKSQKWNTLKRNRGTEIGWLEESELAPEGKYWKSIVNKDSKSATGKDAGRTGTECRFRSRAAKIPLKTSWHSWQLEGDSYIQYRPCEAFQLSFSKGFSELR